MENKRLGRDVLSSSHDAGEVQGESTLEGDQTPTLSLTSPTYCHQQKLNIGLKGHHSELPAQFLQCLPLVPGSVTTRVDYPVLPLIPAGEVRPMPVVTLTQRFYPVGQKTITGKVAPVSSPGLAPVLVEG